jgi:molybdate transport system permease protein
MPLHAEEWTVVQLSFQVAVVAVLISLPLGLVVAMALATSRRLEIE